MWTERQDRWKLRSQTLAVGRIPLLMGVINVTPDSFSDGGLFLDPQTAVDHGLRLAEQGADVLDVGGQSTRPYADAVEPDEELRRVVPVIRSLCEQTPLPVSIDTSKASVAQEAVAAGAEIVNDVTALAGDPMMVEVAARSGVGVCAMHMQGSPRTMQDSPAYDDVVEEVLAYLQNRRDALAAAGVEPARVALDPGIGFGKTPRHNLALLSSAWRLHALGCPVLVGHSRKSFIGVVLDDPSADRTAGTIGVAMSLARQGVQILRVHDVAAVRQALLLYEATGGLP
ncbi:MAG: dihydropteroate synthase [Planctomycetota bacterium]